jgi:CheY-like chemotaxis protein
MRSRLNVFQDLMRFRIMDVVLVATAYDKFVLEEAGELTERLYGEFRNLDLHYPPALIGVSSGEEALALARATEGTTLIVTSPRVKDMDAAELARRVRAEGLDAPVAQLAWNARELAHVLKAVEGSGVERTYLWQGDAAILLAIVKTIEDRHNLEHDVGHHGVQAILVVEDLVKHWSSFLPRMYRVLLESSQNVVREGLNQSQKILRMRARPKILLCTSYEEAEELYRRYHEDVLGIVSDVEFPRGGVQSTTAGVEFAEMARALHPDIPIILHSTKEDSEALATRLNAGFLRKGSATLLDDLGRVMRDVFGLGDFSFRMPTGEEVDRASDLGELQRAVTRIPIESLLFHGRRNHFSRWLKARTEFALARKLRPLTIEHFADPETLRAGLAQAIAEYRWERGQLVVAEFDSTRFDFGSDFYRIGGGSIGGKARGVAFARRLLGEHRMRRRHPGVTVGIPETVVIGTQVFEEFLEHNGLRSFALECTDDEEIYRRFEAGQFGNEFFRELQAFVGLADWPIAVRSSSLLEDSQQRPFAGVYATLMLRNNDPDPVKRRRALGRAVKRVYASTFTQAAKAYIAATPYRLEEERMAVMLQRVIGARHGERYYPHFSGVVRSHNFYPVEPARASDGVAAVALGLGRAVMAEGVSLRFAPSHPRHLLEMSTVEDVLANSQRRFWALPLGEGDTSTPVTEEVCEIEVAEEDGVLDRLASTYSPENDAIYDGTSRAGTRLVTFAPILKQRLMPLPEILNDLMEIGADGMGMPVEIEFAATLSDEPGVPHEFSVLQMRPMSVLAESEAVEISAADRARALVRTRRILGHGRVEGLRDVLVVDHKRFERAASPAAAAEIGRINAGLVEAGTPYLLIGVGRLGSRDPWLGIPVTWDQVSGARVIVEAGLRDLRVTPSQGSHFFQNLIAFNVGYFTVNEGFDEGFVDWDWLDEQKAVSARDHVRHLRLAEPLDVAMDGKNGEGVVLKP